MTVPELRALIKNVYTATTAAQTAGDIPAGEAAPLARMLIEVYVTADIPAVPKV